MNYSGRQSRLQEELERQKLDAMVVTHLPNVRYLCGFTGSAGVLVLRRAGTSRKWQNVFFTDGRYTEQARQQVKGSKVLTPRRASLDAAVEYLADAGACKIGFESQRMTVAARTRMGIEVRDARRGKKPRSRQASSSPVKRSSKIKFHPLSGSIEGLRMIKEPKEIQLVRAAVKLGSQVFDHAVARIRPGITEAAVAAEMEHYARRSGAEGMAFPTLVAAGKRSALPHGVASAHPFPRRGFVIIDLGVILGGYCSDMTRTIHLGVPASEARRMYEAVWEAQQAAIESVRPGVTAATVEGAARRVLQRFGYASFFTHSTGHGVGLEIHEPPRLGKGEQDKLSPGMVITIEPGVYVPGVGGVRIEDMILVTEDGAEVLTPTPKDLIAL